MKKFNFWVGVVMFLLLSNNMFAESWTDDELKVRAYNKVTDTITENGIDALMIQTMKYLDRHGSAFASISNEFAHKSTYSKVPSMKIAYNDMSKRYKILKNRSYDYRRMLQDLSGQKINSKKAKLSKFIKISSRAILKFPILNVFDQVILKRELAKERKMLEKKFNLKLKEELEFFDHPFLWVLDMAAKTVFETINILGSPQTGERSEQIMPKDKTSLEEWLKWHNGSEYGTFANGPINGYIPKGTYMYLRLLYTVDAKYKIPTSYRLGWVLDYEIIRKEGMLGVSKIKSEQDKDNLNVFINSEDNGFTDVTKYDGVYNFIKTARAQKIPITGFADGSFKPNRYITNIQAFALTIYGYTKGHPEDIDGNFLKNKSNDWVKAYTDSTEISKYMTDDIKNNINKNMTRKIMSELLFNLFQPEIKEFLTRDMPKFSFTQDKEDMIKQKLKSLKVDAKKHDPEWPYEAYVLKQLNILNGKNGSAASSSPITRGEFLVMLTNMVNYKYCKRSKCTIEEIIYGG